MLSERTIKALDGIRKCSIDGKRKICDLFEIIVKHPDLWIQAYSNIYANGGATTEGIDRVTQDGFSIERANNLIKLLKEGRYFPKPSRRVLIPKANGKLRPISNPSGDDKLVQEVVRMILEAIYEPIFSIDSHGFRPNHSCHTTLENINTWNGAIWWIEFDIKGFFDNIDQKILVEILAKKIDDEKFLQLIRRMLRAGHVVQWKYHKNYSGTPQGSIVSPILANIYLNELDQFVKTLDYNKGKRRTNNPEYAKVNVQKRTLRELIKKMVSEKVDDHLTIPLKKQLAELSKIQQSLSSKNPADPNFRRLWYCRYADDFLIGFIGPKREATLIKDKIEQFLKLNLNLELSAEKTGIKHAKTEEASFLGYTVKISDNKKLLKVKIRGSYATKRTNIGLPKLSIPKEKINKFCKKNRYGQLERMKATPRLELTKLSDAEILSTYNAELRGYANYYAMAKNVKTELKMLFYIAHTSCVKTLAAKHKTKCTTIFSKMKQKGSLILRYESNGKAKVMKLFKLSELKPISTKYSHVDSIPQTLIYGSKTELIQRLNAQKCEICKKSKGYFEIHHIRKLKDIKDGKQKWQKYMIARRRKTLVLCVECHQLLHAGTLPDWRFKDYRMESAVR